MLLCSQCPIYKTCGGWVVNQQQEFGCLHRCGDCHAKGKECVFACPNNSVRFARMCLEVGSLGYRAEHDVSGPTLPLPFFVPQIHHGSRRWKPLQTEFVAISIDDLMSRTKAGDDPAAIRERFHVEADTRIVALGVAQDHILERQWSDRERVIEWLKNADISAVTTPNFSIFANAPRHQSLVSLARMHRYMDELATAGLATIPHVYAETDNDWINWASFFRSHDKANVIAMEFQTGLRFVDEARAYIEKLSELQQAAGRALHLLAIGGARYIRELKAAFSSYFTITDANSFVKTHRRRRVQDDAQEQALHLDQSTDLADLLQANLRSREVRLLRRLRLPSTLAA